jgi:hypothetical protein
MKSKTRWLLFLLVAIMVSFLFAVSPHTAATEEVRLSQIESALYEAGYYIPSQDCLLYIQNAELTKNAVFSEEEIVATAQEYLYRHGNSLIRRRYCLTCDMKVLTPKGYRPIASLAIGDEIYSWDEFAKKLILNRVRAVHVKDNQEYGTLPYTPTGVALEVSAGHEFLMPEKEMYQEIGRIEAGEKLRAVLMGEAGVCESLLFPMTGYVPPRERAEVYTISLEKAPATFIVEGLVVKNKPDYIFKLIVRLWRSGEKLFHQLSGDVKELGHWNPSGLEV